jgi:hypothetical protein
MAREANGLPYNATNPQNVGAVYFDQTVEPLVQHNANLKALDTSDDFWKMWKLKEADANKKAKIAEGITRDLTVDYKGALPEDIEGVFKPQMNDILNRYAGVVKRLGGNNANLTRDPEYLKIRADINGLKGGIQTSTEHNKILTSDANAYVANPDKYEDESLTGLALGRTKPFDERNALISANGGTFLRVKQPNLEKELQTSLANFAPHIYNVKETPKEMDGKMFTEKISTVDDGKLLANSRSFVLNSRGSVDKVWDNLPPQDQAHYADAANILSNATGDQVDPKTYYVYDWFKNKLGRKEELEGGSVTPERSEAAKEKEEQKSATAMYKLVNAVSELNPEVFAKGKDGNPIRDHEGKYISTDMSGLVVGTRQVEKADGTKETVPDRITGVRVDPANPNIFEIRTDKDAADDQTGEVFSKKLTRDELVYTIAISNFKDAATGLNRFQKAAKEFKDVSGTGIINTNQTVNAPKTINKNWRTATTYIPTGTTAGGVPITEEAKTEVKVETPQKSTAKKATLSKIKSLVGTKGFEGYTEKELVEYYKSQGYTIE